MNVERLTGSAAEQALGDDAFVAAWSSLLTCCPWATGFQSPHFVRTWYAHYRETFEPWIYVARGAAGELDGLLHLAADRNTGRVVVAGDQQAEYHAWLARPEQGDAFIVAALADCRSRGARRAIRFRYLPPNTPLGWLQGPAFARRHSIREHVRPLYALGDGSDARASLKKSGNKKRLKHLTELGPVALRHIADPVEAATCLDKMIPLHDARHASVRGATPFRHDARKRGFYLGLLADPQLLHLSGLYAGDTLVAAHAGVRTGADLQFGLLAHEPTVARASPGKFLIYYLALNLVTEGVARFDLTAGGEGYKERFANGQDVVHTLEVHGSGPRRAAAALTGKAIGWARSFLESRGMSRDGASALFHSAAETRGWAASRDRLTGQCDAPEGAADRVVYHGKLGEVAEPTTPTPQVERNDLRAMLDDAAPLSRWSRRRFFGAAMRRLELGQQCLSLSARGRLEMLAWIERQPPTIGRPALPTPADVVVWEIRTASTADASACLRATLAAAREGKLAPATGEQTVAVAVATRDARMRAALEALGMTNAGPLGPAVAKPVEPDAPNEQTPTTAARAGRAPASATTHKDAS